MKKCPRCEGDGWTMDDIRDSGVVSQCWICDGTGEVPEIKSAAPILKHPTCGPFEERINELERKVLKLKRLLLLVDPVVENEVANDISIKQWNEYLKAFPDERDSDGHI
jgi:hypothetical protein